MAILVEPDNLNLDIYNTLYSDEHLSISKAGMDSYSREMTNIRFELIQRYGTGARVVDLCCGTGSYLLPSLQYFQEAIGVDFSSNMLNILKGNLENRMPRNLTILQEDARQLSIRSESVDFVFSFTSLYTVPHVGRAIAEIGRILRPRGIAVFELGNLWSLNTFVSKWAHAKQGIAKPFHITYPDMLRNIRDAGLTVLQTRVFQLLPMWGGPLWLRPLVDSRWRRVMEVKIGGRMLDERISSLWPFRFLAFRHLFLCEKRK